MYYKVKGHLLLLKSIPFDFRRVGSTCKPSPDRLSEQAGSSYEKDDDSPRILQMSEEKK